MKNRILIMLLLAYGLTYGQSLPDHFYFNQELNRIQIGNFPKNDVYEESSIDSIYLTFFDSDFWEKMHANYDTEHYVLAKLMYRGEEFDSVAIQFKGQTSYKQAKKQGSEKLSFDIKLDEEIGKQDINGYNTFNLNNAFQDFSMMKEVVYANLSRKYMPAVRANFVHLFINGEDWGIYPNIEQLNGDFLKEWFKNNNGSRWRADKPLSANMVPDAAEQPGGGANWGKGFAALNFLGNDTSIYQQYYTLKNSELTEPWNNLVKICDVLNNTPLESIQDSLPNYLNIDATLWFLAHEIAFSDDDSYVHKGEMDYYLYFDEETRLFVPLEFDGNSAMGIRNVEWSPFLNSDNENYPLLKILLNIPDYRQRYIAHMKTILNNSFNEDAINLVDQYNLLIKTFVQSDPKKDFTMNQYNRNVNDLKNFIRNRPGIIMGYDEFKGESPKLSELRHFTNNSEWASPEIDEAVTVRVKAAHGSGVKTVRLHYALGLYEPFQTVEMNDKAQNGDEVAGDNEFSAVIPPTMENIYVRYYVEAIANDEFNTVSYLPEGAEYDVNYYKVNLSASDNRSLVINEFMASNSTTISDETGEYDDWIELYNNSDENIPLKGYFLTDNSDKLDKWSLPDTMIAAKGYMIFWADEDQEQGSNHTNFKLSKSGEEIYLVEPNGLIADGIIYAEQETDRSFARMPNGVGNFQFNVPTFSGINQAANNLYGLNQSAHKPFAYPNPTKGEINLVFPGEKPTNLMVTNTIGQIFFNGSFKEKIDIGNYSPGIYIFKTELGSILVHVN